MPELPKCFVTTMKQQTTGKNHKPACLVVAQQHQNYGKYFGRPLAFPPCFQLPDVDASDPELQIKADKPETYEAVQMEAYTQRAQLGDAGASSTRAQRYFCTEP